MGDAADRARRVVRGLCLAAALVAVAPAAAGARVIESQQYGVWKYEYFSDQLRWCGVTTEWPGGGMALTIRLLPNQLDFFFFNRNWSLTRRQRMGETVFTFGARRFHAATETLDVTNAVFGTFHDGIAAFVERFKRARAMRIEFPTQQWVDVDLTGSSRAIDAAINCWNRRLNR